MPNRQLYKYNYGCFWVLDYVTPPGHAPCALHRQGMGSDIIIKTKYTYVTSDDGQIHINSCYSYIF